MDRLYGGVCYAGIDIDPELKYPKGAGRVAFSNQQSYIAAISARFVQLQHNDIDKRVRLHSFFDQSQSHKHAWYKKQACTMGRRNYAIKIERGMPPVICRNCLVGGLIVLIHLVLPLPLNRWKWNPMSWIIRCATNARGHAVEANSRLCSVLTSLVCNTTANSVGSRFTVVRAVSSTNPWSRRVLNVLDPPSIAGKPCSQASRHLDYRRSIRYVVILSLTLSCVAPPLPFTTPTFDSL